MGIAVLAIVAGGLAQGLALTSGALGKSKVDGLASNLAAAGVEEAHRMAYEDVGTPGGKPTGTIPAVETRSVQGIDFRVATEVDYVDDPAAGQPRTYVNYKRVSVTVTPQTNDGKATTQTSLVAPPAIGSIAGKAAIIVNVVDAITDEPLGDASVTVDGSTSPTRTDTTDEDGLVVFAGLEPSAIDPGDPQYKYRLTVSLSGYVTHPDSVPDVAQQHLAASQTWETTLRVFRPATIVATLLDAATAQPITEPATVTVTAPEPNSLSESGTTQTGSITFTTIDGDPILPSTSDFTVLAEAECYAPHTLTGPVPAGYPASTTETFSFSLTRITSGFLEVTVVDNGTGQPIPAAQVQVSGGEGGLAPIVRTGDANGFVRYCVEPSGSVRYVVSAAAPGYGAGTALADVVANQTTTLEMRLSASGNATIRLRSPASNQLVRLRAVSGTYDASQRTNNRRRADFTDLAAGDYIAYIATGFDGGVPAWSAGRTVQAVAGQLRTYEVP